MARRFQFDRPVEKIDRLTRAELGSLLGDLLTAFSTVNSPEETALFVQDLLTKTEVKMLAKRLGVAKLLLAGMTYSEVEEELHVSHSTVAKVATWLTEKGDGFRSVIKKLNKINKDKSKRVASPGISLRKRIQKYDSPQILVEEIVKKADDKERKKLRQILDNLELKSKLHRRIDKYSKQQYVRNDK